MGALKSWVAKGTGADQAAAAAERSAEEQAQALRESATKSAAQANEAAAQSARQQEQAAARNAAEGAAADALAKPMQSADVQISGVTDPNSSASGLARKRRQQFGMGSSNSGVNI